MRARLLIIAATMEVLKAARDYFGGNYVEPPSISSRGSTMNLESKQIEQ